MSSNSSGAKRPHHHNPRKIKFPSPVNRLRIQVKGGEWSIQKQIDIPSMTLRSSVPLTSNKKGTGQSGFWVDAVDSNQQLIYRATVANPFERQVELFEKSGEMESG